VQARLHFISLKLKRAATAAAAAVAVNTIMKNDFLYYYYNYYYTCEPNIILVYPHSYTVTHITYLRRMHWQTHSWLYIYICVCVFVCMWESMYNIILYTVVMIGMTIPRWRCWLVDRQRRTHLASHSNNTLNNISNI